MKDGKIRFLEMLRTEQNDAVSQNISIIDNYTKIIAMLLRYSIHYAIDASLHIHTHTHRESGSKTRIR